MSSASQLRTAVLLIHGTFAYREAESGAAWWQLNSDFQAALSGLLGPTFDIQPQKDLFRWSGTNSETERRAASTRLSTQILRLEDEGRPYMIVGHSHGGSVLFDALVKASAQIPGLPGLQRWITVGTPFLRFESERNIVWLSIALIAVLAGMAWALPLHWRIASTGWLDIISAPRLAEIMITLLLDVGLFLLLVASSGRLLRSTYGQLRENQLNRLRDTTFEALRSRYIGIHSAEDEAINGLGSTLAFGGPMMVRLRSWWGGLYNRLVAPIGDQFIWKVLSRRAQGNDIAGIRLEKVLSAPVPNAQHVDLGDQASESLVRQANTRLADVASGLRGALYAVAFNAQPIEYLRVASQKAGAVESLVHTGYFTNTSVRERIGAALLGHASAAEVASTVTAPQTPRFTLLTVVWATGIGMAALLLSWQLVALLKPLQPRTMIATAVAQSGFLAATYSDPEQPYELVRALASHGHVSDAERLVSQVQMFDDSKTARAALAVGLRSAGRATEGIQVLLELSNAKATKPTLPQGSYGPDAPQPSMGDLAIARALGQYGMSSEALAFVSLFDGDRVQKQLAVAVLEGLVLSNQVSLLGKWIEPSEAAVSNPELVARALELTCEDPFDMQARMSSEVDAARLKRDLRCGRGMDVAEELVKLQHAPARVLAACDVARLWAAQGRNNDAAKMLSHEYESFPKFKRHPLEGLAVHHVRYATAFFDIGKPEQARQIMEAIETLRGERFKDGTSEATADDDSEADRALLWARLGDTERALRWWDKLPEDMSELETKFRLLSRITAELSRTAQTSPVLEPLSRQRDVDAPRWLRMASVFAAIGAYDGATESRSRLQQARTLSDIGEKARKIDSPEQRSNANAHIAERYLDIGMPRAALSLAGLCQPVDQIQILKRAVELYS